MVNLLAKSLIQSDQDAPNTARHFQQQLRDLVTKITITADLAILHPDYEPLLVAQQYRTHLQQMSESGRDRYLTLKLQKYLYDVFMGRCLKLAVASENLDSDQPKTMVNQGDRWYETEFYHQLLKYNHGRGYSDPNWLVVGQTGQRWQVIKDGLTLWIDPERHLPEPNAVLQKGQIISIKMPPSLVDHGVYIAVGNLGRVSDRQCISEPSILQLYFNVNSATAIILLDCLSKQLNHLKIPFDFQLAYRPDDFAFLDAAILEFSSQNWQQLQPIIKQVYFSNQTGFQPKIPFFCQHIAPGLGLAEKPFFPSNIEVQNLGYQHCEVIAQAIIKLSKQPDYDEDQGFGKILDCLLKQGLNLECLYLNSSSTTSNRHT